MNTKSLLFLSLMVFSFSTWAGANEALKHTRQIILTVGKSPQGPEAQLWLLSKEKGRWAVQDKFPAVIGRSGVATGLGLYQEGPFKLDQEKREGDGKAPGGVFELGDIYGAAERLPFSTNFTYHQSTPSLQGVDDPLSRYYNRIVDITKVEADWKSHEEILRKDDLYKWLIEIRHNPLNVKERGSLIFLHVWKGPVSSTAGCTALEERNLLKVLRFLDKRKNPRFVLLTEDKLAAFMKLIQ